MESRWLRYSCPGCGGCIQKKREAYLNNWLELRETWNLMKLWLHAPLDISGLEIEGVAISHRSGNIVIDMYQQK